MGADRHATYTNLLLRASAMLHQAEILSNTVRVLHIVGLMLIGSGIRTLRGFKNEAQRGAQRLRRRVHEGAGGGGRAGGGRVAAERWDARFVTLRDASVGARTRKAERRGGVEECCARELVFDLQRRVSTRRPPG